MRLEFLLLLFFTQVKKSKKKPIFKKFWNKQNRVALSKYLQITLKIVQVRLEFVRY